MWPADRAVPTADDPAIAVVMVPRPGADGAPPTTADGDPAPTWIFPFDAPASPEEGDNQALAVATQDGSVAYDVAFALVWADEGRAVNVNEAYALASCTGCAAVAVAFQVVLVVGQADVVVPQNIAAAVTYRCVDCVTYALAVQLVLTLTGPLSPETSARLDELWAQIAEFGASVQDVPLDEIRDRLTAFEAELVELVQSDPAAAPASGPAGTAPTTTPTTTPTTSPSGDSPSASPGGSAGDPTSSPSGPTSEPGTTGTATEPATTTTAPTSAPTSEPTSSTTASTTASPGASATRTSPSAAPTTSP